MQINDRSWRLSKAKDTNFRGGNISSYFVSTYLVTDKVITERL